MIEIYSLRESSLDVSFDFCPKFVTDNLGKDGYFTLIAVDKSEKEQKEAGQRPASFQARPAPNR